MLRGFSQTTQNTEFNKEGYLEKSKSQKTTAWVFLASGAAATIIGVIGFSETFNLSDNSADGYGILAIGGPVIALGSIPFFISSGNNARKAASLSINFKPTLVPNKILLVQNTPPSLAITIAF